MKAPTKAKPAKPVKPAKTETAKKVKSLVNVMRNIRIEKVILSCGGVDKELAKAKKLLELMTAPRKSQVIKSSKRIPDFAVSPGMEVGVRVTLRGREAIELLKRLLGSVDNILKKKQVAPDHFSFGIKEYIEIPGMEYQRDIGIRGLNVTVVFNRPGIRVQRKKIKSGCLPKKQHVSQMEIINYMGDNFKTKFK